MTAIHHPAFADLIPEDVANRAKARRHLAAMDSARRAALEAEWMAAEAINDRSLIEADRKAIVERGNV